MSGDEELSAMRVIALRCEYLHNPLGIDEPAPRLDWVLDAPGRGQRQSAYRVQVASTIEALLAGSGDLWDSGAVASDQSQQVVYAGRALGSGERAWWRVQVWDGDGRPPAPSEVAWWEMGLLQRDDWRGEWIGLPAPAAPSEVAPPGLTGLIPSPYLRTTIALHGEVARARLYATARGVYALWLNGRRVGDAHLAPGWTDYDRRIQYQSYDVTASLHEGENLLGALLGTGWYAGYVGMGLQHWLYGARPQLLAQLEIDYANGSRQTFVSDGAWRGTTGPIRYADLLMGEFYDARRELDGWAAPGFDDRDWHPVVAALRDRVPLVAECAQPVRVTEELAARQVTEAAPGTAVVDLGQNICGWVRLRVEEAAGTTIRLRYSEMLNADGTLYTDNLRGARATDHYVCRGGGVEQFEPHFTFHGFRYVEVSGITGPLDAAAITGRVVGSDTPLAGRFTSSSALVNQLARNIDWGQRGNFLSVPTDCPQRDERFGWMGDAQVFVRTATCNRDVAAFFTKWLNDVADAQSLAGAYPNIAPRWGSILDSTPAWSDAGVVVPWTIWQCYGDTRLIDRHWAAMTRWIDYLEAANPDGLWQARRGNDFGDWLSVEAETPKELIGTAFFAYDARLMAEMARATGRDAEAARFEALFARVAAAFVRAYVAGDGRLRGETQTAYVLALHFGLLPEARRSLAVHHLVDDIERRGGHLSTGFVGCPYLCPVLAAHGHLDLAYRLLLNTTYPSWGYSIAQGATTVWERWDSWTEERGFQSPGMNSFNHYAYGAIGEWLYRQVAGLDTDPTAPGYRQIVIAPRPGGGLTHARAELRSPYGLIISAWTLDGDRLTLQVVIPVNTTATVSIPASSADTVRESGQALDQARGVRQVREERGCVICTVGSGEYHFSAVY